MSYFTTLQSVAGADLRAHWQCDDSTATVQDYSGNNYDLTLSGTSGTNYKRRQFSLLPNDTAGKSIWFDGVSGRAYRNATGAINLSRTNYTLNVWCQVDPLTTNTSATMMGIRLKYQLNSYATKQWESVLEDNSNSYSTKTSNSDFSSNYGSDDPAGSYMVTMVWSDPILTIYVNGILMRTRTLSSYTDPTASGAFGLANIGNGAAANSYFNGWLQHASIITKSLTISEVRTLYQAGVSSPVANSAMAYPWVTTIVPSTPGRKSITLTNESTSVVWLSFGGTPVANRAIPLLPFGGRWSSTTYDGEITAVIARTIGYSNLTVLSE
jgi:hypothetical protein